MTLHTKSTSTDPIQPAQEESAEVPELPVAEAAADAAARLQDELKAARDESAEWHDRFLRKAAEMENFRKRSDRERIEAATAVKSSVLIEFLPIMDACERAMESFKDKQGERHHLQQYREGVELLYKQLANTLSRLGVVALEAKGHPFDPNLHEALTHQETLEFDDHTVIEELRRGYMFKERLLRPTQVVVASRPKPKEESPTQ